MHPAAETWIRGQLQGLLQPRRLVVEFGSYDVNGSARSWRADSPWYGIDTRPGPGVDEVADASSWKPYPRWSVDTVVCTEVLEHAPTASEIVRNAYRVLAPGGVFLVTCAGPGRTPHGRDGGAGVPAGEFYQGISVAALYRWLFLAGFAVRQVTSGDLHDQDTYAAAVKP